MAVSRRSAVAALASLPLAAHAAAATPATKESSRMYGLIGKMRAQPGQRDALIAILLEGTAAMPGCLGYVVAKDLQDADALWITETWDSRESHKASLSLPSVQAAIAKGRPLIAGFGERFETEPVGGQGLMGKRSA
ncbi:putative quinol monooxygenase [Massilia sp. ST3]|uniref:putative quinol monooxygenase n=1 Tax=Massilia sp. ST3 TaxID=2824903 RepID=UPI001B83141F|nr:putative quinol monooxygenase [Massilia sp. ST3]MBQ5949252.1 antibiotic biosynthesis monooxygenase [Massilia sp. ST3]